MVHLPIGDTPCYKWFFCPACFGELQVFAAPIEGDINPAMQAVVDAEQQVLSAIRIVAPDCFRIIEEIERLFVRRPGPLENLVRNVLIGWPEDKPPPKNHPLRVEFLAHAAKAATQLF
ncbi:MAG: hypothetical protein HY291_20650 [Planctomycetes bacterium]|nr:hypothetical protein [Planctomycetota bacterium]